MYSSYPQRQYPVQQQPNFQYPAYPPPYSQSAPYPSTYPAPYPAGQYCQGGQCPQQQIIYRDAPPRRSNWTNDPWLMSLLALCCGCFLGEALCDQPCCCCLIPCSMPRFR